MADFVNDDFLNLPEEGVKLKLPYSDQLSYIITHPKGNVSVKKGQSLADLKPHFDKGSVLQILSASGRLVMACTLDQEGCIKKVKTLSGETQYAAYILKECLKPDDFRALDTAIKKGDRHSLSLEDCLLPAETLIPKVKKSIEDFEQKDKRGKLIADRLRGVPLPLDVFPPKLNTDNARLVGQKEYCIVSADQKQHALATYYVRDCVAVACYNPDTRKAALAHTDIATSLESFEVMLKEIKQGLKPGHKIHVHLAGGDDRPSRVRDILALLNDREFDIRTADISAFPGTKTAKQIVIDAKTGAVQDAQNVVDADALDKGKTSKQVISGERSSIARLEESGFRHPAKIQESMRFPYVDIPETPLQWHNKFTPAHKRKGIQQDIP